MRLKEVLQNAVLCFLILTGASMNSAAASNETTLLFK